MYISIIDEIIEMRNKTESNTLEKVVEEENELEE